jgi:hypothetical protein
VIDIGGKRRGSSAAAARSLQLITCATEQLILAELPHGMIDQLQIKNES